MYKIQSFSSESTRRVNQELQYLCLHNKCTAVPSRNVNKTHVQFKWIFQIIRDIEKNKKGLNSPLSYMCLKANQEELRGHIFKPEI